MENKKTIRLDKFLWCVRIAKTRKLSLNLCNQKKIKVNSQIAKPSKRVIKNDIIIVNKKNIFYQYKVINIIKTRINASLIKDYIIDITPVEEIDKIKIKNIYPRIYREKGAGRPTKKDRRILKKNKLIN